MLIAGSNAFPRLTFTVSGGNTQTVCMPFQLLATAADVDGAVTNITILLDGASIASASGSVVSTTAEIDFAGAYAFTARASDDRGGTTWATQQVTLATYPLHWLIAGGFRTNGVFKLCMQGETNQNYQVLVSDDLNSTNWFPIGIMESTNGTWRFLDTRATNHTRRFYHAEQVR